MLVGFVASDPFFNITFVLGTSTSAPVNRKTWSRFLKSGYTIAYRIESLKTAMQNLTTASHKLAEEMYKKASEDAASTGTGPDGDSGPTASGSEEPTVGDEKVVDAEFEEVDKGKS